MFHDFKKFILRGNVIDLAVGVIIGGAFNQIVSSAVNDIFMPFLSILTKGIHLENIFFTLDGNHYDTLQQALDAQAATVNMGQFLTAVINFLLMALVVFFLVKAINGLQSKVLPEPPALEIEPSTKACPFCRTEINIKATRCSHCTSVLSGGASEDEPGA